VNTSEWLYAFAAACCPNAPPRGPCHLVAVTASPPCRGLRRGVGVPAEQGGGEQYLDGLRVHLHGRGVRVTDNRGVRDEPRTAHDGPEAHAGDDGRPRRRPAGSCGREGRGGEGVAFPWHVLAPLD